MIIRDFPRWAVWVMNFAVIAALSVIVYFLRWAGTEFCVGAIIGFAWCYIQFRCWRFDYDEEPKQERVFTEPLINMSDLLPKSEPQQPPRLSDH
jgi:hypothetical protein